MELPEDPTALQEDVSGVRHSRRIAQIKIKEEAERRKIEEMTLTDIKEKKKKSKKGEDKVRIKGVMMFFFLIFNHFLQLQ